MKRWVVLKFGGTSVASPERWEQIAKLARDRLPTHRVWIVISAVAGVTNLLERAIEEALREGRAPRHREPERGLRGMPALGEIRARHEALAHELEVAGETHAFLHRRLEELTAWLHGVQLTGEAPPRLRARILAIGELLSTELGAAVLRRRGLDARWVDARDLLVATMRHGISPERRYLDARVAAVQDIARADAAADGADLIVTQGFIASGTPGETVLLGRGGSDTSAALFAALIGAERLEIWSDVPGLFTADPGLLPTARLLRRIEPRDAQELAAAGAKALHPRCVQPVAQFGIPVWLRSTLDPELPGTSIESTSEDHPVVHAVTHRAGVTLVTISTLAMWETSGFLAHVFHPFADLDISVDLVATSQSAVSVTLDRTPDGGIHGPSFEALVDRLKKLGEVRVVHPCAVVSIVGRRIRAVLHDLGPALEVLGDRPVHLVSDSSEDLNLSLVVDERDGPTLVARLHERLFLAQGEDGRLGPTWEQIVHGRSRRRFHAAGRSISVTEPSGWDARSTGSHEFASGQSASRRPWWAEERERLLPLVADGQARYVYHLPTVARAARLLRESLPSIDRFYYAMKANSHPRILKTVEAAGFGIECVSAPELELAREVLGGACRLLFTPNFCPPDEYRFALESGADITLDGVDLFRQHPEIFRGRAVGVRVDPGRGMGHHRHVLTAGARSKFGMPLEELGSFLEAAREIEAKVVGLHAHIGSGILDPQAWASTGQILAEMVEIASDLEWIDLGGGLGVPERPGQEPLDLALMESLLARMRSRLPGVELRLEPGRFLVSEAGVLIAPVTQVRRKQGTNLVGISTGMNSLIRPALYGAWHGIHNLSRLGEEAVDYWNLVGPICESSDVLGRDRWLPRTVPGDVVLIENAGAYGAVMSSRYNQRPPAEEVILD